LPKTPILCIMKFFTKLCHTTKRLTVIGIFLLSNTVILGG
jgi:hypothetical protein